MSDQLVFTAPSVRSESVVTYLQGRGVADESISVVGNTDAISADLPDGGFLENDTVPAVKRGATIGGAMGLLAGLGAVTIAPGIILAGAAVALAATGGASLGALGASIVGASVPNSLLREYTDAMERGELLIVVKVDTADKKALEADLTDRFDFLNFHGELDTSTPIV